MPRATHRRHSGHFRGRSWRASERHRPREGNSWVLWRLPGHCGFGCAAFCRMLGACRMLGVCRMLVACCACLAFVARLELVESWIWCESLRRVDRARRASCGLRRAGCRGLLCGMLRVEICRKLDFFKHSRKKSNKRADLACETCRILPNGDGSWIFRQVS